jgi:hypothetical protein
MKYPLHFISTFVRGYNKSNFSSTGTRDMTGTCPGGVMNVEQAKRNQKMMTQRPYCCGNCPNYYDMGDGQFTRPDIENRFRRGQCRQNPPVAGQDWPKVSYMDFCGAHPSAPMNRTQQLLALMVSDTWDKRDAASGRGQVGS